MKLKDFNFEWFLEIFKDDVENIQKLIEIWGIN